MRLSYILRKTRGYFGLTQDKILDMFILVVPSGIVGARLYYVLFHPDGFFGAGNWLNIFKIRQGGLAIYGGIIAAVIAIFIYSRRKKIPAAVFFDVGALGLLIGQAIGRWGNFFNREAYGYETELPWKMGLISGSNTVYVHPTFLYESLWNNIGFIWIHRFSKKNRKYDGQVFLLYVAWYGLGRFIIEGLRSDSLYLFGSDIRISQLVAALSFGVAVYLLFRIRHRGSLTPERLYANRVKLAKNKNTDEAHTDASDSPSDGIRARTGTESTVENDEKSQE